MVTPTTSARVRTSSRSAGMGAPDCRPPNPSVTASCTLVGTVGLGEDVNPQLGLPLGVPLDDDVRLEDVDPVPLAVPVPLPVAEDVAVRLPLREAVPPALTLRVDVTVRVPVPGGLTLRLTVPVPVALPVVEGEPVELAVPLDVQVALPVGGGVPGGVPLTLALAL